MGELGKYLYGVIKSPRQEEFGTMGLGEPGSESGRVYTINHRGLAACVSNFPAEEPIQPTREHCLMHERVLEAVMARFTILPFEFGIVAPSTEAVMKLLAVNAAGLQSELRRLHGMVEVNVKAFWPDLTRICQEVAREHAAIARYRKEIAAKPPEATYQDRIALGQMVAVAVNERRKRETQTIMAALRKVATNSDQGMVYGAEMVMNGWFLMRKEDFSRFEHSLKALGKRYEGRGDFKYTGPVPPYHFMKVTLKGL